MDQRGLTSTVQSELLRFHPSALLCGSQCVFSFKSIKQFLLGQVELELPFVVPQTSLSSPALQCLFRLGRSPFLSFFLSPFHACTQESQLQELCASKCEVHLLATIPRQTLHCSHLSALRGTTLIDQRQRRLPYFNLGITGQLASPFPRLGPLFSNMETLIMSNCD